MFRYLIAIGDHRSGVDRNALKKICRYSQKSHGIWRVALDGPGFLAAYARDDLSHNAAISLQGSHGVIFGTLFSSLSDDTAAGPIRAVSQDQSERIVESKGHSLISDYWGHYVAAIYQPNASRALVLRSPVSSLSCLHLRLGTLQVFFSHVEDCIALELTALSINWDAIAAQVVGGDYLTTETGVEEIHAIDCGACVECTPDGCTTHGYWDPRSLLTDRRLDDFDMAARAIRNTTHHCVSAVSSTHDHVLVKLSGGLDSSIVLSTLSEAPHKPTLSGVNYYSRGCGDERRFARSMAATVGCRLIEQPRNGQLDLRRMQDCNWTVQPVLNFSAADTEGRTISLARELGASTIINGELGDNVFGSNVAEGALLECFNQDLLGRRFLSAAIDYATLTRRSMWRTLVLACREWSSLSSRPDFSAAHELRRRHGTEMATAMFLASAEAAEQNRDAGDRFVHPWLKGSRKLAPGSHSILLGLIVVTSSSYHSPFACHGDPPQLSPLLSQPLVELALRIPADLHFKHGQNRAVARAAFADRLPAEVLHRGTGKGGPTLWTRDVIERNAAYVREYLLDGILVQRRLLDRNKVAAMLSPQIAKSTAIVGDVIAKLYIESWLRKWQQLKIPLDRRSAAPDYG